MGLTVDTVVSTIAWGVPTRSPIWALAAPAMPSMGDAIFVKPRSSSALRTCAWDASTWASALCTEPTALSLSLWLTALAAANGRIRFRLAWEVCSTACCLAMPALASSTAAWNGRGSISNKRAPFLTKSPSL